MLWLLVGILWPQYQWPKSHEQRAAFGETFGAVNALFAGLAFAGLIWAILLQRDELELQRQELRDTRAELEGQKEQLRLQNETMARQTFENTFFQLLGLHHDIVGAMHVYRPTRWIDGREAFQALYMFYREEQQGTPGRDQDTRERLNAGYLTFFHKHQSVVGHYFRHLYNIVKFVDNSQIKNKKFYTNLLRAQLSAPELLLLFYNCLSIKGRDKFKPLVERYALLKTVPQEQLIEATDVALYEQDAFAGS